jgi:single-strand DNA-binding protein
MFETMVTVVGRVVTEPTRHRFPSGDLKTSFRIMAVERRYNRETNEWGDGDRLFLAVNCWRRLADGVATSVVKGDHVVVAGRLYVRQYMTEGGDRRDSFELDARAVGPDLSWCTVAVERPTSPLTEPSTGLPGEEVISRRAA